MRENALPGSMTRRKIEDHRKFCKMRQNGKKAEWLMESVCAAAEAATLQDLTVVALPRLAQVFEARLAGCVEMTLLPSLQLRGHIPAGMPNPIDDYWSGDYHEIDPMEELRRSRLKPRVSVVSQLVDQKRLKSSSVYNEIMQPYEIEQLMEADLVLGDCNTPGTSGLVLFRAGRQEAFDKECLKLLGKIAPAFEAVARRQSQVTQMEEILEGVFNPSDTHGYAALEGGGRPLWISPQGEKLLRGNLGGKRRLPEALIAAVKKIVGLTQTKEFTDPPPFQVKWTGEDGRRLCAQLRLARLRRTGDPYIVAHLFQLGEGGGDDPEILQPPASVLKDNFGLSKREADVVHHLMRGRTNMEIAKALFISPETVRTHLQHIFEKLGVQSRLQAVVKICGTLAP